MQGFSKEEHLCKKNDFESVFKEGTVLYVYPVKLIYRIVPCENFGVKVGVLVPKRLMRNASDRNRVKRLLRESYRLQKNILYDKMESSLFCVRLLFIYTDAGLLSFSFVKKCVNLLMTKFLKKNKFLLSKKIDE